MWTLEQLKEKMYIQWAGHGAYKVRFYYRGRICFYTSNDSLAWDRLGEDIPEKARGVDGLTLKQAYVRFFKGAFAPMFRY